MRRTQAEHRLTRAAADGRSGVRALRALDFARPLLSYNVIPHHDFRNVKDE